MDLASAIGALGGVFGCDGAWELASVGGDSFLEGGFLWVAWAAGGDGCYALFEVGASFGLDGAFGFGAECVEGAVVVDADAGAGAVVLVVSAELVGELERGHGWEGGQVTLRPFSAVLFMYSCSFVS